MRKVFIISLIVAFVMAFMTPLGVEAKGWEQLKVERPDAKHVASASEIQIRAGRGVIYVTTTRTFNIKIYTILGSQIANDNLQAGAYQFSVPAHGVYIIKAGDLTCKVAV